MTSNTMYTLSQETLQVQTKFTSAVLRRDFSVDNGLNIWVVADNIRKGAATNAIQIAEQLLEDMDD